MLCFADQLLIVDNDWVEIPEYVDPALGRYANTYNLLLCFFLFSVFLFTLLLLLL